MRKLGLGASAAARISLVLCNGAAFINPIDGLSPFCPCGHDLTELFESTAWQLLVNFRIADAPAI